MATSDDFERAFKSSRPPAGSDGGAGARAARAGLAALLALLLVFVVLMFSTGQGGVVDVQDHQATVIVNYVTGEREVVSTPGYAIFLPFVQQAYLFDKSPQEFVMAGDTTQDENHVAKLTVRASDGSNFWFDEVKLQYELIPDAAGLVLGDSGPEDSFKQNWVRAFSRSILRDEFGEFDAIEVADATNYQAATREAQDRLNALLNRHGVRIIQIPPPRPKFEPRYEKAIEDRKVADQTVQKLRTQAEQLQQERERRLAQIDSLRAVEFEALKGALAAQRISAEKDRVRIERSADAYKTRKLGEGEAVLAAFLEEARGLTEKAKKEAEGLVAIAAALDQGGRILVREQLAGLLPRIEFQLMPYSRDPAPTRVELEDSRVAARTEGGAP